VGRERSTGFLAIATRAKAEEQKPLLTGRSPIGLAGVKQAHLSTTRHPYPIKL